MQGLSRTCGESCMRSSYIGLMGSKSLVPNPHTVALRKRFGRRSCRVEFERNALLTAVRLHPRGTMGGSMTHAVAVVLALSALFLPVAAQEPSDCPPRAVINNGVCIGKDGNDCSK